MLVLAVCVCLSMLCMSSVMVVLQSRLCLHGQCVVVDKEAHNSGTVRLYWKYNNCLMIYNAVRMIMVKVNMADKQRQKQATTVAM